MIRMVSLVGTSTAPPQQHHLLHHLVVAILSSDACELMSVSRAPDKVKRWYGTNNHPWRFYSVTFYGNNKRSEI